MIQRKPSKIVESIVNSAHEDHFTVAKAVRDDAPITADNSVIKSINFESDGDSAYILRRPLVKKFSLGENQIILSNKEDILTITNNALTITNANRIILKFYDNFLTLHEITYNNSLPCSWLTIKDSCITADQTLLNVTIAHESFLRNVGGVSNAVIVEINHQVYVTDFKWKLVNDTYTASLPFEDSASGFIAPNSAYGDLLKRFVKVYPHESEASTYVFEIVNPELNSITSGLDSDNAETLDINLLLDNPYAIRDLYNYGYVSCTKIVPYVYISDTASSNLPINIIYNKTIWELTEKGPYNSRASGFTILVSSKQEDFNKKFLILKAFLTLSKTSANYLCRWEVSNDDGITWSELSNAEYYDRFPEDQIVTKLVSDLTSSEFDKTMYDDSLEKAQSYLVEKKLVRMDVTKGYSFLDRIEDRPDVLVIQNPNFSYKYRFVIYLESDKESPIPAIYTYTVSKNTFTATSGDIDTNGKFTYSINNNDTGNTDTLAPRVADGYIYLNPSDPVYKNITGYQNYIGDGTESSPQRYMGLGNSLRIESTDSTYKLKNVSITLGNKELIPDTTDYNCVGAVIGVPPTSNGNVMPLYVNQGLTNPYGMNSTTNVREVTTTIGSISYTDYFIRYDAKNLWLSSRATKTLSCAGKTAVSIVNLTGCVYSEDLQTMSGTDVHSRAAAKISNITITYTTEESVEFTDTYLTSTTGTFYVPYSDSYETVDDLTLDRNRLFRGTMYFNENQAQMLVYKDNYIYASGTNTTIFKLLNNITIPENITKIIPWRGYILIFASRNIYLASYDKSIDAYNIKILSNTVGVSSADADTVVPILNSVYFKSGSKIYKLIPNLYAASDDILNIHQVSIGVNNTLESIVNKYIENHNFAYTDADVYMVYIPIDVLNKTISIVYDFNKQIWTIQEYNVLLDNVEKVSNTEIYLKTVADNSHISTVCYFRESLRNLLEKGLTEYCTDEDEDIGDYNLDMFINAVPYADYLTYTPKELIELVIENATENDSFVDTFTSVMTPIYFEIDFGQKSSNYTLDKQFLETKLILATLSPKENFPLSIDIYTDGISRDIHIDANTDSALWKKSLDDIGILNTNLNVDDYKYYEILRQLIVKYSGKGKSIRHIISGYAKSLFKFYSMDVRARILPKKH